MLIKKIFLNMFVTFSGPSYNILILIYTHLLFPNLNKYIQEENKLVHSIHEVML